MLLISRLIRVKYVLLIVQPYTILQYKRYFQELTLTNVNVSTISGTTNLIEGSRRASIILSNGTTFHINNALYVKPGKILFSKKE